MTCSTCGTENPQGQKFCGECGAPLLAGCPSCGADSPPDQRFCGECGTPLATVTAPTPAAAAPVAERRLVSVLFADLVGYTSLSEGRDFEDVRDLQSRYFESARQVIERYGGTVEKFIGDAVMAVWGTPVAQEDDAERAVRAALELVSAVEALASDADAPELRARAGVLTGEAAVTLGAEGQGMVTGDLVNTASRVQSAADPGRVLVGEATKRASEAAIVYEDGGTHELKGKDEALQLWRVTRVVAGRGGEGRAAGLEAPFVGRDRELRLVKELFHTTADEGRAHLLVVVGVAGIGKSRLAWEFEKYADGLAAPDIWWHRGRCLSYGDGVAYWALAEMVRMRAGIAEDETEGQALGKLRRAVEEFLTDPEERALVEPRLQHLLGLTERVAPDREDLFSAWRLFFERMAERGPVALVFEDLHWADVALVEFVEYLLDWSRSLPIFVIALARPELAERHPAFGTGARSFTSLMLEPLAAEAIDALLRGLVPGLPDDVLERIRERADGVPLYAVETVRMLLDRGLLEPGEAGYRVSGDIEALDVPQSLHALIAARLDGLDLDERRVIQDAAVLGKTFAPRGVAALSGLTEDAVRPLLAGLVRKEVLFLESNARSPERGQYGFLQALVQRVAYETLSRRDRKAKHVAAATYMAEAAGIDPDEIADVIAAHYRDAFEADPKAADADDVRASAREWLRRAGERAAGLAATEDARRLFDDAVQLTVEPLERAALLERAGELALEANEPGLSLERLHEARGVYAEAGRSHDAARVAARLSLALWTAGRTEEAVELGEPAFELLSRDEPDADVAMLAAELARVHHFVGNGGLALERLEYALAFAEAHELPEVLSQALNTKALILMSRPHESRALLREALAVALEHELTGAALRAYNNLYVGAGVADRPDERRKYAREGLELARRRGHRQFAAGFTSLTCIALVEDGAWDEAFAFAEELPRTESAVPSVMAAHCSLAFAALERGDDERAMRLLGSISPDVDSGDRQQHSLGLMKQMLVALTEGRPADVLLPAREHIELALQMGVPPAAAWTLETAAAASVAVGAQEQLDVLTALFDAVPPATRTRRLEAALGRARGLAAATRGDETGAADGFASGLAAARNLGHPPVLGPVLVDYGAWLASCGRRDEAQPLLAEARALFEGIGAVRWLERIDAVSPVAAPA